MVTRGLRKIRGNKKGDLPDMLVFVVITFILAVGLFVLAFVIPEISSKLATSGMNNSAEGQGAIDQMASIGTTIIPYGFLFLFGGLIISTLITSFFIRTHPIFMFLYIAFLALSILISLYLGNAYEQLSQNPIFASTFSSSSLINLIMGNIVQITLAVGALSIIIVFAKFRSGVGDGSAPGL